LGGSSQLTDYYLSAILATKESVDEILVFHQFKFEPSPS